MHPRNITIGGKRYRFVWGDAGQLNGREAVGHCDNPAASNRRIVLEPRLDGGHNQMLRFLVHELLHGAAWDHDEAWVDKTSIEIAKVLYDFGFRREL